MVVQDRVPQTGSTKRQASRGYITHAHRSIRNINAVWLQTYDALDMLANVDEKGDVVNMTGTARLAMTPC